MRWAAEAQNRTLERKENASTIHVVIGHFSLEPLAPGGARRGFAHLPLAAGFGGAVSGQAHPRHRAGRRRRRHRRVRPRPRRHGKLRAWPARCGREPAGRERHDRRAAGHQCQSGWLYGRLRLEQPADRGAAFHECALHAGRLRCDVRRRLLRLHALRPAELPRQQSEGDDRRGSGTAEYLYLGQRGRGRNAPSRRRARPADARFEDDRRALPGRQPKSQRAAGRTYQFLRRLGRRRHGSDPCENDEVPAADHRRGQSGGARCVRARQHRTCRPRRDDLVGNDRAERHPRRADGASSNGVSRRAAKRAMRGILAAQGATPRMRTGDTLRTAIHNEYTALGDVAKRLGLQKP